MLLDILLAIVLGFAIGFEREITNKWAGLRTHMLVCLGSCIFTPLSIHAFPVFAHSPQADPARIAKTDFDRYRFYRRWYCFEARLFHIRFDNSRYTVDYGKYRYGLRMRFYFACYCLYGFCCVYTCFNQNF